MRWGCRCQAYQSIGLDMSHPIWHAASMHEEPFNLLGIPPDAWTRTPESVRLVVLTLLDMVQQQSAPITGLHTRVCELEAKLGQTSRTSPKPPSSDETITNRGLGVALALLALPV